MAKKKQGILHSQISGTIWFAAVLIVILAFVFFFFPKSDNASQQDSKEQKNIADLQKKEDSVYHSRHWKNDSRKGDYKWTPPSSSHEDSKRGKKSWREIDSGRQVTASRFYTTEPPVPTRKPLVVELNSADTTTLQLLHGIGPAYARRIVKYRERLGGFTSTEQLLEVYGFTPELLDHIRPSLRLDTQALQKINVNTMTLKQLIKHPYMEYYFARDLVNLRSSGATFLSPDDLRAIPSCSDTLLTRLLPYLDFNN